jgi:hypothetical protein
MSAPLRTLLALVAMTGLLLGAQDASATHSFGARAELVALVGEPATYAVFLATPAYRDIDRPDCSTVLVVDLARTPHAPVAGPRTEPGPDPDTPSRESWVPGCVARILSTPAPIRWLPEADRRRWQIEHFDDLEGFIAGHAEDPSAMPDTLRVAVPSIFGHTGTVPPVGFEHLKVELVEEDVRRDVCLFAFEAPPSECAAPGCPSCTGDACDGTCAHPDPDTCPDPCGDCISDVITYRFRVTDTRTGATADGTRFIASAETLVQAEMMCPDKSPVEMALDTLAVHETETAIIVYGSVIHGLMSNDTSIPIIAVLPSAPRTVIASQAPAAGCGSCQGGAAEDEAGNALFGLLALGSLLALSLRRGALPSAR